MTDNQVMKYSNLESSDIENDAEKDCKMSKFNNFTLLLKKIRPPLLNLVMWNVMPLRKTVTPKIL